MSRPVRQGAVPLLATRAARAALDPVLRRIAREIVGEAVGREAAERLLSAVQRLVTFERERKEVFRPPLVTWKRGAGDCDDSAPLLAALASAVGIPAELVPMGAGGSPTHVVARLFGEWAETTLPGAQLGEHPGAALVRLGRTMAAPSPAALALSGRLRKGFLWGKTSNNNRTVSNLGDLAPDFVARATAARVTMTAAWSQQMGRPPTRFELLWALCWSKIDTSWGRGWSAPCADPVKCACDCAGSNNWGAVHAVGSQEACPWADRYPNGESYCVGIRKYPDAVTGAADFVRHLVVLRPETGKALARVASVREVCLTMIRENYFGGFCPKASAQGFGGKTEACRNEAADGATLRAHAELSQITAALGWPMPRLRDDNPRVAYYDQGMTGPSSSGGGGAILALGALAVGGYFLYRSSKKKG